MTVEIGQVLWLRLRFNNVGEISAGRHPYVVLKAVDDNTIEVAQLDKVRGKAWKVALESNKLISLENPHETVITEDSFIQMDNTFQLECFSGIEAYRRNDDKFSETKLKTIIHAYEKYHNTHEIDENKQVYIAKSELLELN